MKERLGIFVIAVIFTFGAGFVFQDPKSKTEGETGLKGQKVTTDKLSDSATLSDSDFVKRVVTNNRAEIELGQMAITKAASADVKQFAQRMIDDHTKANTELTELAQSKGWSLPAADTSNNTASATTDSNRTTGSTTNRTSGSEADKWSDSNRPKALDEQQMQSDHKAKKDKLSGLTGAEFDREYMRHMVMDHQKAVALFERQAKNKDGDAALKSWAEKMLPALREHHRMARDIACKVGAKLTDATANSSNR